ncbi:UDP-3-O-(3-hydroxymyristoyl)glucosamine N-acyltransferase [Altererythrobacter arenosus]|uniref:UDP-3-O-(3-hydroxymyristoyl)glucosamine N-acyltransferase n=1 Tax=Altererythrobacter arenosus TaxID=3032592 RepID=A0ABY8FUN8_9SPHN|nr:UDP-3-O-(3-hydroxymyristoyl)glucosamine N-acyltransferase [Altererythrobacter sp. CAU 1644]WFL78716.1 UDP-3-O-(3-hydroxymyristoyl)glucosamine N-acyltransferase [Altererythrobacter sp. CAU 1644]
MRNTLSKRVRASELAASMGLPWFGTDVSISHVRTLDTVDEGALAFANSDLDQKRHCAATIIAKPGARISKGAVIEADNPRLAFARALHQIERLAGFRGYEAEASVGEGAKVSSTAVLGRSVTIGARTVIGENVVICDGTRIGSDCIIKSNTVIGEPGFGFERDENGVPVRIMHLGDVVIGDRVEIGSLNTICRATLGTTVVEDDVKTDDHVHIAHNCRIRRGALITACVELSGGVDVGEFSWIGPNSSLMQKITVGDGSLVGIGSNVTKPVAKGSTVAGNPARVLRASTDPQ